MADLVPLFPLPNVVLLPRVVLPLHIFEDRYKAMIEDALAGDGRIAMALLSPGWEKNYHGFPPVESVVCVGQIIQHEKLDDGKYNFLLQGVSRSRIQREERVGMYRVAEVIPLESPDVLEIDLLPHREKLLQLFRGPLARLPLAPQFSELLRTIITTTDAADVIAYHLLTDLRDKQFILEETDPRNRANRLIEQLESLGKSLQPNPTHDQIGPPPGLN